MSVLEVVAIVAVVLLALVVGALLPAIVQTRRTLKAAETFIESTGRRLDHTLDEVSQAAARMNRVGGEIEESLKHIRGMLAAADDLAAAAGRLRRVIETWGSVAAAIGPAVAAAIRSIVHPKPGGPVDGPPAGADPQDGGEGQGQGGGNTPS